MSNPNPLAAGPAGLDKAMADLDAGDLAAAAAGADELLARHPQDHAVLNFAAYLALYTGRFGDAENLYRRAIAAAGDARLQAISWNGLGQLGKTVRNLDLAEEAFRRALLADPADLDHALEFADTLAQRGKLEVALELQRSSMLRHPQDPRPCIGAGNCLMLMYRHKDALAFYDMALQRNPNYASGHFNASVALTMLGKIDTARQACVTAFRLDPAAEGYYQLALLGGLEPGDERLAPLEARLAQPDAPVTARIDAGFALAQVYDKAGDTARAFEALRQGNALKRGTLNYDIKHDEERMQRIMALFTRDFMLRFADASDSKLEPIFILGMPRSGSTLVEQMLAGHSRVMGGGELPYMPEIARQVGETWGNRGPASPGSDEQVRSDLLHAVQSYTRSTAPLQHQDRIFTDKLPGNFLLVGLIQLMFPRAHFIHVKRDPVDSCLSCYERLFSSDLPFTYDLTELGQYYNLYRDVMKHWHATLPGRILDVDYESVVAEPEQNVRRILEFCGLGFEPACLDFQETKRAITTASAIQVRQPLYQTAVRRWKKYEAELTPLLQALGPA
jgi:tetratricopeptide (TPR) repeat protein